MPLDESTQFHLDKSAATLFETGRKLEAAFTLSVFTYSIAILLTFSVTSDDSVSIPLISIELVKWNAAAFTILLFAVSWFRLILLGHAHSLMLRTTEALLDKAGMAPTTFDLKYPSALGILSDIEDFGWPGKVVFVATVAIMSIGATLGMLAMICYVGYQSAGSIFWWSTSIVSVALLVASFLVLGSVVTEDRRGIEKLQQLGLEFDSKE